MGRPKGIKVDSSITIRGTKKQIEAVKQKARKNHHSISQYCIEKILKEDD